MIISRRLLETPAFAEILRQKILRAMGDNDVAVVNFEKSEPKKDQ